MSAAKTIFRKLIVTVCILVCMMFVYSAVILNRPETTTTLPMAGGNVEQVAPQDVQTDDLGHVLDSVELDYAA